MEDNLIDRAIQEVKQRDFFSAATCLKGKTILLYGAGGFGRYMLSWLEKAQVPVTAFLDRAAKPGDFCDNYPVFTAENALFDRSESVVLFCILMDQAERVSVITWLHGLGYQNILEALSLRCLLIQPDDLQEGEDFNCYYGRRLSDIKYARTLFQEDLSQDLYSTLVAAHMTGSYSACAQYESSLREQYFPSDIPLSKGYQRFVDCGAYVGDTVEQLLERYCPVDACAAFEPDNECFQRMARCLSQKKDKIREKLLFPCAVSDRSGLQYFECSPGSGKLCEAGSMAVQTVLLDEVIPDFQPTFIKMDIEGAELGALRGARNLIAQNRPDLAICVYHAVNHIWDIPLLLDRWGLGYQFYLRSYAGYTTETVLYAVSK